MYTEYRYRSHTCVITHLQESECDTEQDPSQPELIRQFAHFAGCAGFQVVELDCICLWNTSSAFTWYNNNDHTHPNQCVMGQVAKVAELASDGGQLFSSMA